MAQGLVSDMFSVGETSALVCVRVGIYLTPLPWAENNTRSFLKWSADGFERKIVNILNQLPTKIKEHSLT